jgi:hypothetical protein
MMDPTPPSEDAPCTHAAIFYGGIDHGAQIRESYDFWHYVQSVNEIVQHDSDRVLVAESRAGVEQLLATRYPTMPGCTRVIFHQNVAIDLSPPETAGRRNRWHSAVPGWVVLKYPLLADPQDIDQLRTLCVERGTLYVTAGAYQKLGGQAVLGATGFVIRSGGPLYYCMTWNPKIQVIHARRDAQRQYAQHAQGFSVGFTRRPPRGREPAALAGPPSVPRGGQLRHERPVCVGEADVGPLAKSPAMAAI